MLSLLTQIHTRETPGGLHYTCLRQNWGWTPVLTQSDVDTQPAHTHTQLVSQTSDNTRSPTHNLTLSERIHSPHSHQRLNVNKLPCMYLVGVHTQENDPHPDLNHNPRHNRVWPFRTLSVISIPESQKTYRFGLLLIAAKHRHTIYD